jgi:GntR family transcriptional regulator
MMTRRSCLGQWDKRSNPEGGSVADPRYRQIAESLRRQIEDGELRHGEQIPTELELREIYDASRNTVRDAVKWLITRGLVETRPGQGTFVVEKIDPFVTVVDSRSGFGAGEGTASYASEVAAHRRKATVSDPRIEIHQADAYVAGELDLAEGSLVVSRAQRRYIDGTPWSLQTSYYSLRYVEAGARRLIEAVDMPDGVLNYLAGELGVEAGTWRDRIVVRPADGGEAFFFKLPDNGRIAVLEIHRTLLEKAGPPLRLTITTYPVDRNEFVMSGGDD